MRAGSYEVLDEIGRGGLGVVFRGRGEDGRTVAIKLIQSRDPEARARFAREQRLQSGLGEAEGFVPLLGTGEANGQPYLVMPFLPGGTLRALLEKGPLEVERTSELGRLLGRALGEAHARGIVHRDVKPENVLFTADGRPLVADLGLAKHFDRRMPGASQSASLSVEGCFRGTPGYMSPEQLDDSHGVGPPADVFALGCVLYECLTGARAFPGDSAVELLANLADGRFAPVRSVRADVPLPVARVIERALAKEPGQRFRDGFELARALERGEGRRRPWKIVAAMALFALVGAALARHVSGRESPAALAARAEELVEHDKPKDAVELATRAIALDATFARAWVVRSHARRRAGDVDGALADAARAIELSPGLGEAWAERAVARSHKGDTRGALADATRAIELSPGIARAWAVRGAARGELGDREGLLSDMTRAIELDPAIGEAWANRGITRCLQGDLEGALADLTRAIELDPTTALAWAFRGAARGEKDDVEGQLADSTRALELDRSLAMAWVNRAVARGKKGDPAGELEDLTRAVQVDPGFASAWSSRGEALVKEERFEEAIQDFTHLIEIDRGNAPAYSSRGIAREATGDHDGAIADMTRALELDPTLVPAWLNRGVARANKGDEAGAIEDWTRVLDLDPRLAHAWYSRGRARASTGDDAGARSDLERFLELAPDDPQAPWAREWLAENK